MIARDWLKTLWRTSYKGAAFWVETDTEGGGRRIVIHEFPMRDTPYLEDLGERYRDFVVTAYVASDRADAEGAALMQICAMRGAGPLVLPTQGPVLVRCLEFSRTHSKDKMGYIAFSLRFVREGASGALASVASLINLVFVRAEAAAAIATQLYAATALIKSVPDYVQAALQFGTENALATLEAVRTSTDVAPTVSATKRDAIAAAYTALPSVLATEDVTALRGVAESVVSAAMVMAENMTPSVAISVMRDIIEATPSRVDPPANTASKWRSMSAQNLNTANELLRLSALISYCEAVARASLLDRPSAITLRANVSMLFEEQLENLRSEQYDLFLKMTELRDATIEYLSRSIIDLAPVVRVTASLSRPSLYWSWRMYEDPTRAMEIVERNRLAHPSFIPPQFEALGE